MSKNCWLKIYKRTDSQRVFFGDGLANPQRSWPDRTGILKNGPLESDLPHIHLDILRLRDSSKCWGFVRSDGGPF